MKVAGFTSSAGSPPTRASAIQASASSRQRVTPDRAASASATMNPTLCRVRR